MRQLPEPVKIAQLLLDPENPRLPEDLLGASQEDILTYLYEHDVLDELADSMLLNGFFENEPLIVLPPETTGYRVVAEGNRRLATLMILAQSEVAERAGLSFETSGSTVASIDEVPAFEVANRDELASYLGFRHINGIRTWGANEKARYVWERVNSADTQKDPDPFYTVGRTVGSNARGVRSSYIAYALLRNRELTELEPEASHYVARRRFGVWLRLLGTKYVPQLLKLDHDARSFSEVTRNLSQVDVARLSEVVRDLTPPNEASPAVLADSRDVTAYSDILGNSEAHRLLRETGNLLLAKSVLSQSDFGRQVVEIVARVDLLLDMVSTQTEIDDETLGQLNRLVRLSRSLHGAAKEVARGEEED